MSNQRYAPEFKDEAVRQVDERGYSVSEVSTRLSVCAHRSLLAESRQTSFQGRRWATI
jgi:transposase-like protein